jgi:hypothetical protein
MPSIKKELPRRSGEMVSNRYQVRRFKTSQAMHEFLNKQFDNEWKEMPEDIKSGTYFTQMDCDGLIKYYSVHDLL